MRREKVLENLRGSFILWVVDVMAIWDMDMEMYARKGTP